MTLLALCGLLEHCKIETNGLGPEGNGQAGAPNEQGAGGDPAGSGGGGVNGEAGAAGQTGAGAGGTANGAGGVGGAGAAGAGAAGVGGGGASGGGGSGGSVSLCNPTKGQFSVPSEPRSCFLFLGKGGLTLPPSSRTEWEWPEAVADCNAIGGQLASLGTLAEYEDIRQAIARDRGDGLTINGSVWLGAATGIASGNQTDVAKSFIWQNTGVDWIYDVPGAEPWDPGEPSLPFFFSDLERCVEMRIEVDFRMNNTNCDDRRRFALCELPAPITKLDVAPSNRPRRTLCRLDS